MRWSATALTFSLIVLAGGIIFAQDADTIVSKDKDRKFPLSRKSTIQKKRRHSCVWSRKPNRRCVELATNFLKLYSQSWSLAQVLEIAASSAIDLSKFGEALDDGSFSLRLVPENPRHMAGYALACFRAGLMLVFTMLAGLSNAQSSHTGSLKGNSGFVGSKACYGCHTGIYRSFEKTDMARSMTAAAEWSTELLPPQASVTQIGTGRTFQVFHNAGAWHQKESEPRLFTVEHSLEYAVGSGTNGLTFLIRRGNYLFQAPLSYYSKAKIWHFSPGYEHMDLGFGRSVPQECINCHAGRASPVNNRPGAFENPPFQELAIGCENCHGPGGAHVQSLGKEAGSIVNPGKLPSRLAENICMNCHQSGDARVLQAGKNFSDFHPGDWLLDTAVILKRPSQTREQQESDLLEHSSAMEASRCFRESKGKLGCLTCHDPHVQPRVTEVAGYFRSKCLTCHNEQSCKLPVDVRAGHSPPNDCAGCHMPKRGVQQISHSALTNHRIPAKADEPAPLISQKEVDGVVVVNAPPGRSVQLPPLILLRAYGQLSAQDPAYGARFLNLLDELRTTEPQNPFVQSALGRKALAEDKPEEAIAHLKSASGLTDATVDLEMGEALVKLGRYEEAIKYLKKAVDLDPYDAVMQKTLILQYINTRAYREARERMERYIDTFPEDSFMRGLLAKVNQ